MKICIISDTHGLHERIPPLPKADILIHAGDITNMGTEDDIRRFVHWFQNLKGYGSKIFIAGNHDWGFEWKKPWLFNYINDENLSQSDCYYLEDNFMTITDPEFSRPIKIYGTPWQPDFCNWAFNVPRDELYLYWEKIPLDTDVLITHGPPQGILDMNLEGEHCGCASLTTHTYKINPALHIFGHIHEAYNTEVIGNTLFVNASTCTRRYVPSNKPIVVDLTEVDGKLIANIVENE
jgi:Icc-related predicted phosphoesterase